jgi:hypothetical protein
VACRETRGESELDAVCATFATYRGRTTRVIHIVELSPVPIGKLKKDDTIAA